MVYDEVIILYLYNDIFLLLNMFWIKKVFVFFLSSLFELKIFCIYSVLIFYILCLWEMLSSKFFLKICGLIVYKICVFVNEGLGFFEIKMIIKINNKNNEVL